MGGHPAARCSASYGGASVTHIYSHLDMQWKGTELRLNSGRLLAEVIPDMEWGKMWRVFTVHDRRLSDMVNLTRAKDAAVLLAMQHLNERREP